MTRFFSQMMKLPLAAFVFSMEMLVKTMQGLQRMADQGIEAMMSGAAQPFGATPSSQSVLTDNPELPMTSGAISDGDGDQTGDQSTDKEECNMTNLDLSGNTLKVVHYSIIFTKRDYETTLEEKEETINYPTDGGSYGGQKLVEFFARVANGDVERPTKWKEKNYPTKDSPNRRWSLPEEDRRFVRFVFEVRERLEREEKEYDREKVEVLREIRDKIPKIPKL